MGNFDSYVSNYLKSNPEASADSIKSQMQNIQNGLRGDALSKDNSVFAFNGEVDQEQLTNFINSASKEGALDKEVATLFSILDQDGSGKLTDEELQLLRGKKGQIDSFTFWKTINVDEKKIGSGSAGNAPGGVAANNAANSANNTNQTNLNINQIAEKIVNGQDKLENYYGKLSQKDYEALSKACNDLSAKRADTQSNGNTQNVNPPANNAPSTPAPSTPPSANPVDEAAQAEADAKAKAAATEKEKAAAEAKAKEAEKTEKENAQINRIVGELHEAMNGAGTKEDILNEILYDDKISPAMFTKIVQRFEEKHGMGNGVEGESFVKWISHDTSGDDRETLLNGVATKLAQAANAGDEDAIKLICRETYSSIDGVGTIDEFIEPLFQNLNDDTIGKVNEKYSTATQGKGKNLLDDVQSEYWLPTYGDDIISKIRTSLRHYTG